MNTELSGPDLGLATGDSEVRIFEFRSAPSLSHSLSFLYFRYRIQAVYNVNCTLTTLGVQS
jgi:hypothetical protein